ncbi:MAG: acyl carrier protein [Acidobacteriia bacterium]|nr:acyl carrier protein [Terriglobia bacterium]
MSPGVFEQVRSIAADLFAVPNHRLTAESSPETLEAWDSTQHLILVLALEERFGFQLYPEEIEQMHNLGDVARVVDAKLHAAKS